MSNKTFTELEEIFPYQMDLLSRIKLLFKRKRHYQDIIDRKEQTGHIYVIDVYYKIMDNKKYIIKKKLLRDFYAKEV